MTTLLVSLPNNTKKNKTKIEAEKELMKIRKDFNGAFIVKTKTNPIKIN